MVKSIAYQQYGFLRYTLSSISSAALYCGEPPLLENGEFSLANTTVNSTAVYFCEEGYRESLGLGMSNEIQCMPDGTWSQLNLECVALGKKNVLIKSAFSTQNCCLLT